jgi:hypothetical protein
MKAKQHDRTTIQRRTARLASALWSPSNPFLPEGYLCLTSGTGL